MRRLLLLLALLFAPALAYAQNQLPAVPGSSGPVIATPAVAVGYDETTGTPCVVGRLTSCRLPIAPTVRANFSRSNITSTSWAVLVDLSNDSGNFPVTGTGAIDVTTLSAQVDLGSNSVGLAQYGVITRVDGTSGDVQLLGALRFEHGTASNITRDVNYLPTQIRTRVVGGKTPYIVGSQILNDTGLQTDVALDSPIGAASVFPAVGDIVVHFVHTSGAAWSGSLSILYYGEAP